MTISSAFRLLILIATLFGGVSCSVNKNFNTRELQLIHEGSASERMHLTTIAQPKDSIILRTKSIDIKTIKNNKALQILLKRMLVTMIAEEGIGIAAPQVGINRNIFLFTKFEGDKEQVQVAINPKIIKHSENKVCFQRDGCLSVPDKRGNSLRYEWIEVTYYNEEGKLIKERLTGYHRPNDFSNIIFQHEFDHINGKLYIDKLCNH
ncbi:MAG TPA: peptide deformylase [Edaphocola sp.]|nr:peptide deformylase [Edaphocola sp.]